MLTIEDDSDDIQLTEKRKYSFCEDDSRGTGNTSSNRSDGVNDQTYSSAISPPLTIGQSVNPCPDVRFTNDFFESYYVSPETTEDMNRKSFIGKPQEKRSKTNEEAKDDATPQQITIMKVPRNLPKIEIDRSRKLIPKRSKENTLIFPDFPEFQPNLNPKEIIQRGSFGGTYFRPITSTITGQSYQDVWREFPYDWFDGLNIAEYVTSSVYNVHINYYKVFCGSTLKLWEESGWITAADPYGWFQWYCRFYQGRRCSDDHRQISRALGIMGPNGRWKRNLINKCIHSGKTAEETYQNNTIAPKIRQLLQHWGYELTITDVSPPI